MSSPVELLGAQATGVNFKTRLKAGSTRLMTWFYDEVDHSRGAYFVSVNFLGE